MTAEELEADIRTNILVVDDRQQNLVALEAILQPLGQNVVSARSGEAALRELLETDFAVILLDVVMPGLDGFETAALIKERAKTRHIPIIFLTAASPQEQYVARGYTLGAVDYITKPFHAEILRAKVAVFVELFRKNEQIRRQAELLRQGERRERERALDELRRLGEQRYQELAESMPQIVWTASPDGRTSYCNRRWLDYTGLDHDADGGEGWKRVVHLDDLVGMESAWRDALGERRDFEVAARFRRSSDGSYRWHLVRAVPVLDALADVAGWIATITDIDDRVRAEEGLRLLAEASRRLASSLDHRRTIAAVAELAVPSVADWCAIDLREDDGTVRRIALVHPNAEKVALAREIERRYPAGPADFYTCELPPGEAAPQVHARLPDAVLIRSARDEEHLRLLRELRLESWILVPISVRGEAIGALRLATAESGRRFGPVDVALAEDLARRISAAVDNARLYEAAQRERTALEEAARVKDEFLAVLSHELRSPLNATLGWAQMLRAGTLDAATQAVAVETIERSARAQARLIGDLLDVSRIITGKLRLTLAAADLAAVVRAAADAARPLAAEKGVELRCRVELEQVVLRGDSERLQQIAWNLLSNAIKFTPRGGTIEVVLDGAGTTVRLAVTDTGAGIPREFLPYVFDRFRQADSSSTRTQGGLGLGLSIVRHLAELHGGRAFAESEGPGRGATVGVELPCASAEPQPGPSSAPEEPARDEIALAGLRVLVVEDLPDGRMLFQAMLDRSGANVTTASCADEALALLGRERFDVLVSDIGLPDRDGYEIVRTVRRGEDEGRRPRLPAVALTAYASESDRQLAAEAGFDAHVAKPVDRCALIAAWDPLESTCRHASLSIL